MDANISVIELTKRFGDFTAVNQVNLEVYPGEIFGFLGPNGSGKTTTIRMMLGLLKPTDGLIEILGMPVQSQTANIRPRVGYMSQRFSLYNDLTVLQNLNFYGAAYGLEESLLQQRILDALEMSGLQGREKNLTRDLSGGWRQRLALSAAILHRPEILFLDEPTAGVDPISRREFWGLLYRLVSDGISVFVTTHYMDEAEHCHRLAFIQHGEIIAYGPLAEIKSRWMHGQVLELAPHDPIQTVKILQDASQSGSLPIQEVELYGSLVHITGTDLPNHLQAIKAILQHAGLQPGQMAFIEPSLEDVFIACMQG